MSDEIETEVVGKFLKRLVEIDDLQHEVISVLQTGLKESKLPKAEKLAEDILQAIEDK